MRFEEQTPAPRGPPGVSTGSRGAGIAAGASRVYPVLVTETPAISNGDFCKGSETLTRGFRVAVSPIYLRQHSDPDQRRFVFAYRIRIANESDGPARLLSRHWLILDANGGRNEVRGEGVVGQQPVLNPGESYEYESYCPLPTSWGTMEGSYTMAEPDGTKFPIAVARFYLAAPAEPPIDRPRPRRLAAPGTAGPETR